MIRKTLNGLAGFIRLCRRMVGRLFRGAAGLVLVAMISLNVAMVALPAVYNMASRLLWGAVSLISEGYAARSSTQATTGQDARRVRADADTARARQAELIAERDALRAERTRLDARMVELEGELDVSRRNEASARRVAADLGRERDAMSTRLSVSERQTADLAARQRRLQAEAGETLTRMQRRSIVRLGRNTGSVAAEAIPVAGAAVVVGTVVWDIYDTCSQMSDMRALTDAIGLRADDAPSDTARWCGMTPQELRATLWSFEQTPEGRCHAARRRTQRLDPPECADFPIQEPRFEDFPSREAPAVPDLPTMNDY